MKRPTVSEKHRIYRALIQGKKILEQKRASATNRRKKDEDSERIDAFNRLLRSYAEILPAQVILLAINMYEQGKSYDEIERYLQYEQRRKKEKVEDSEEDDDFQRKQAINNLLKSYQKSLSSEVILSAIKMYEQGKSYDEIESYLQYEQSREESLGNVDYYGGRTLKEAREEIEDDELDR